MQSSQGLSQWQSHQIESSQRRKGPAEDPVKSSNGSPRSSQQLGKGQISQGEGTQGRGSQGRPSRAQSSQGQKEGTQTYRKQDNAADEAKNQGTCMSLKIYGISFMPTA